MERMISQNLQPLRLVPLPASMATRSWLFGGELETLRDGVLDMGSLERTHFGGDGGGAEGSLQGSLGFMRR